MSPTGACASPFPPGVQPHAHSITTLNFFFKSILLVFFSFNSFSPSHAPPQQHTDNTSLTRIFLLLFHDARRWKTLVPFLYDWFTHHRLVWPSLSCRWGPVLERHDYKHKQRWGLCTSRIQLRPIA
jgi:hypothetical protein